MIQVSELTKYYGETRALNGMSFNIEAGEITGLVGRNGAGKSTVLNILCGQLLPTAGEAFVNALSVTGAPLQVRQQIGFLPEIAPLYDDMTLEGYLAYLARLRGVPASGVASRVDEVMERTGLRGWGGAHLDTLSRGYRQRAGIAQAIVHDPPVVLLDEPMAGLDPMQIVQMRDFIADLKPDHTVLFSTHILSEVTHVCDRVILVDQGAVRYEGSEAELRRSLTRERKLSLLVRGARPQLEQVLANWPEATAEIMEGEEPGLYRAHVAAGEDLREPLSQAIVEAGLGLLELKSESDELEALFVELVQSPGGTPS